MTYLLGGLADLGPTLDQGLDEVMPFSGILAKCGHVDGVQTLLCERIFTALGALGMLTLTVLRDNGLWTFTGLRALGCGHCFKGQWMWTPTALGALGCGYRFKGQWDVDTYCFKEQWDVDSYCLRGVGMWTLTVSRDNGMWTLTALEALGCGHCLKGQWDVDAYCLRDVGMWMHTALGALGCEHLLP